MNEIVFLLEEPSAEALLQALLPRISSAEYVVRYIVFEGKQDLEKQLVRRLRGYQSPAKFVVLRDQDSADCEKVKSELRSKCEEAGKSNALVRIACKELESWYIADLAAVGKALEISKLAAKQNKAKYREPDKLVSPAHELKKLTEYKYQKVAGSRAIGKYLNVENARSKSFSVFVSGVRKLIGE